MLNIGESDAQCNSRAQCHFRKLTLNGIPSYSPKLHFIMEPSLQIVAYFNSNALVHASEIYNGLFYDETNGVSEETAGMFSQLTIPTPPDYTPANCFLNGETLSLAGQFNPDGTTTSLIARADSKGGPVKVQLTAIGHQPNPRHSFRFQSQTVDFHPLRRSLSCGLKFQRKYISSRVQYEHRCFLPQRLFIYYKSSWPMGFRRHIARRLADQSGCPRANK